MLNVYSNTKRRRLIKVGNKVVGHLEGSRFIKSVIGSIHRLRCPPAWAIDAEVFDSQVKTNATEFLIVDRETRLEYHCSVKTFDRLKGELDRGFGRQYYLTLNHWTIEGNGHKQLTLWGDESHA